MLVHGSAVQDDAWLCPLTKMSMNVLDSLLQLHNGANEAFRSIINCLTNAEVKALRLSYKSLTQPLFPFLFRCIYISSFSDDLEVFQRIAQHPTARHYVREIRWDDQCLESYGHYYSLPDIHSYRRNLRSRYYYDDRLQPADDDLQAAYNFWVNEGIYFDRNHACQEVKMLFQSCVDTNAFPGLRVITILGRSRLSYVDPEVYEKLWQTLEQGE